MQGDKLCSIGVNPGDWGISTPDFGLGGSLGVAGGSWMGLGRPILYRKYVGKWFFKQKRDKLGKNIGVSGKN